MAKRRRSAERRKHKRFKAPKGAFAVMRPDYNILGQIKDISKAGLAFLYNGYRRDTAGFFEIDIVFIEEDFYLRKIPVKTAFDRQVMETDSVGLLPRRQLGMQFQKMSSSQKSHLNFFLKKYTFPAN